MPDLRLKLKFFKFIGSNCEGDNLMILRSRGEPTPQPKKRRHCPTSMCDQLSILTTSNKRLSAQNTQMFLVK